MAVVSGFERLGAEHRAWLLREWRRTGYGDNERIARELARRLAEEGAEGAEPSPHPLPGGEGKQGGGRSTPSPPDASTVWRWARAEKGRAARIRYAAELRAATIAALPEDDAALAEKVGAYMEGRLVEAIEDLDAVGALDPIARLDALARLTQANTARRRVAVERERAELARDRFESEQQIRAEERARAAGAAESAARGQGVSPEGIAALRAAIMGAL